MRFLSRTTFELGDDFCLSPERWISNETAAALEGDTLLKDVVELISVQMNPPAGAKFVLDTGNAREGLIDLPILGDVISTRTSAKKVAREGDVIISRLRPYLRQVALFPTGISATLGQENFFCSSEFFVFRSKDNRNIAGLVAWLLSDPIQAIVCDAATGGHHPRINSDLLLNAPIDEKFLAQDYCKQLDNILARHINGQRELLILLRH